MTAALEAVRMWRFKPARFKGQPISVYHLYRVTFRLS
jgi:outer membrane biosynthesis protein TonB